MVRKLHMLNNGYIANISDLDLPFSAQIGGLRMSSTPITEFGVRCAVIRRLPIVSGTTKEEIMKKLIECLK